MITTRSAEEISVQNSFHALENGDACPAARAVGPASPLTEAEAALSPERDAEALSGPLIG